MDVCCEINTLKLYKKSNFIQKKFKLLNNLSLESTMHSKNITHCDYKY